MDLHLALAYQIGLWISAVVTWTVALLVSRATDVPGRRPFVMLNIGAGIWAATSALQPLIADPESKLWLMKAASVGFSTLGAAWCSFGIQFAVRNRSLSTIRLALLYAFPVFVILAAFTNDWHRLAWAAWSVRETLVGDLLVGTHGPVIWILSVYSYIMFMIGTVMLVWSSIKLGSTYRGQSAVLTIAALIPILGDVSFKFRLVDLGWVEPTPFLMSLSSLFVVWAMLGFGAFTVLPIAHHVLFRSMNEGAIVIDNRGHIVDINVRALALLGATPNIMGETVEALSPFLPELDRFFEPAVTLQREIELTGKESIWVEVSMTPLIDRAGIRVGSLLALRDITDRKKEDERRTLLMKEVQAALANVRTLSGLLPICYHCKKVRDDKGYWKQVESYVTEQTGSKFSHGLCPSCFTELYPEVARKQRERQQRS